MLEYCLRTKTTSSTNEIIPSKIERKRANFTFSSILLLFFSEKKTKPERRLREEIRLNHLFGFALEYF